MEEAKPAETAEERPPSRWSVEIAKAEEMLAENHERLAATRRAMGMLTDQKARLEERIATLREVIAEDEATAEE